MERQTTRTRRRETAEMPIKYGVGGWLAKPPRAPITALHFIGRGFEVPLDPTMNEIRVGRAFPPDVDVHIPFGIVSRQHATLRRDSEGLRVTDGGSQNGTSTAYVDEQRTWRHTANQQGPKLHAGDRLYLGSIQARALDDRGRQLVELLSRWMPRENYRAVDAAVEAILVQRPLVLNDYSRQVRGGAGARDPRALGPARVPVYRDREATRTPARVRQGLHEGRLRGRVHRPVEDAQAPAPLPRSAPIEALPPLADVRRAHGGAGSRPARCVVPRSTRPALRADRDQLPEEVNERFCQENPIVTPRPAARRRPAKTSGRKLKPRKRDRWTVRSRGNGA